MNVEQPEPDWVSKCGAQPAEESLRQLLYILSHDLRNPVIGLRMLLGQLLQENAEEMVPVPRAMLERMLEGGDRQLHLINALLDAHADHTQPLQPHRQPLQLEPLLGQMVKDIAPCLDKNRATLDCAIAPDLPAVDADADQILRVFEHLIRNAMFHNPPGVHLKIDAAVEGKFVRCCVQDNGIGIAPEQQSQLFSRHYRCETNPRTQGLGLGLYLCRQIVQAHGGTIAATSQVGEGVAIAFTLPIAAIAPTRLLATIGTAKVTEE